MPYIGRNVTVSVGGESFTFINHGTTPCSVTCNVLEGSPIGFNGGQRKVVTVVSSASVGDHDYTHACDGFHPVDNPKIIVTG
jgi:hypothetical protein